MLAYPAAALHVRMSDFRAAYPGYGATSKLDELRAAEYAYLDEGGHVYLDYTGAGLPARSQLLAHETRVADRACTATRTRRIRPPRRPPSWSSGPGRRCCGTSARTDEYAGIFTPNATGACRLVGESYPFGRRSRLVLTADNHNSVNGIREFAPGRAPCGLRGRTARAAGPGDLLAAIAEAAERGRPVRLPGAVQLHRRAASARAGCAGAGARLGRAAGRAAFVPTSRLDLSRGKPDFVPITWYKVFGYPTGVGGLLARRPALARLRRPWFSGGTIVAANVQGERAPDPAGHARSRTARSTTSAFPPSRSGSTRRVGMDPISRRVQRLTGMAARCLTRLRHRRAPSRVRLRSDDLGSGAGVRSRSISCTRTAARSTSARSSRRARRHLGSHRMLLQPGAGRVGVLALARASARGARPAGWSRRRGAAHPARRLPEQSACPPAAPSGYRSASPQRRRPGHLPLLHRAHTATAVADLSGLAPRATLLRRAPPAPSVGGASDGAER